MHTSDDASSLPDSLEQRVLEILDLDEPAWQSALDALYREHPEHAGKIRTWLDAASLGKDGTVVAIGRGRGSTWRKLVEQLRSRGPAWTRYVFEGEIARGGMGVVHRVRDQDAHRSLALKVILGQGEAAPTGDTPPVDDRSLGRFLEEAQVASQLDHPGIVPVHEIGVDGEGRVYFTMKLVQGQDLRAVFDMVRTGQDDWSETRVLNVLLRVCEAMAYAHAKGVIHRDLKPANVMVGKFGEVYVMDWGLARVLDRKDDEDHPTRDASSTVERVKSDRKAQAEETPGSLVTMDGDVVGTPSYMPPEQAEGRLRDIGPATDVYAVGAMLYHLLAGQMPYVRPGAKVSPHSLLTTVVERPPVPLSELRRDVTSELLAIVEKAMARELADRYPDMTALARDLQAFLENRVVSAYETGAWAELKKWVQRNKALATTAAAAVVAVAALAGWALVERETAKENEQTALAREKEASDERDRVLRLSDLKDLDELLVRMDTLWPAHPENIGALESWLRDAEELLGHLEAHEATLKELRSRGVREEHTRAPELLSLRAERKELATRLDAATEEEERLALTEQIEALDNQIATLKATIEREQPHAFPGKSQDGWWHDTLVGLVSGLHALNGHDVYGATHASVVRRLDDARTIRKRSIGEHRLAWDEAIAAIVASPSYGGLKLREQIGLVPIGADPDSGLWEFWHVPTGDRPKRDEETHALTITGETGLVFVLIPGGKYWIGAQADDPNAPNYDAHALSDESPVHELTLIPYFLSKYEMAQGQWARITGTNPAWWMGMQPDWTSLAHPVENVSWTMCRETLTRLGLVFPTEEQWETACRAVTGTAWSFGDDPTAFSEHGNIRDAAYARTMRSAHPASCESFDDGYGPPAKVGTFQANDFGLHDMHGNVWEWCAHSYRAYNVPPRPRDTPRAQRGAESRVCRGGSCDTLAIAARSSIRIINSPERRNLFLGCRPAKLVER